MIHMIGNKTRLDTRFLFLTQLMGVSLNFEKSLPLDSHLGCDFAEPSAALVSREKQKHCHYHRFTQPYGHKR